MLEMNCLCFFSFNNIILRGSFIKSHLLSNTTNHAIDSRQCSYDVCRPVPISTMCTPRAGLLIR